MVYVIMDSAGQRNESGGQRIAKGIAFSVAAAVAASVAGVILGQLGSYLGFQERAAIASVLSLAGVTLGLGELSGFGIRPLQCDRETPRRWMRRGRTFGASLNGAALGFGATTRIGFWLWYVVPMGAFLVGRPALGAALYGLYGTVRGLSPWIIIALVGASRGRYQTEFSTAADWLIRRLDSARALAAAQLLVVSGAVALNVGL
jgi:hypothetical protein